MTRLWTALAALAVTSAAAMPAWSAHAQKGIPATSVLVGGQAMVSDHDFLDNLQKSPDLSTFYALLRSAGMAELLQGHGPFTVFAPTNAAFARLPPDQLDRLRRPENRSQLAAMLGANIVPGNFSAARLHYLLRQNKGSVDLDTVNEGKITVALNGPLNIMVRGKGEAADIILYDVKQANGVLFVTDQVLQPG